MKNQGKLYLIPLPLAPDSVYGPDAASIELIARLRQFVVEDIRTARRFLRKTDSGFPIDECKFLLLNEHTSAEELSALAPVLQNGNDTGLLSEAGMPCIADPGANLVRMAHEMGIAVVPLPGPVSLMLALAGSGFNGQNFVFHGYLPVEKNARRKKLADIEQQSFKTGAAQLFIETPYRNLRMFEDVRSVCQPATRLCIAANLTMPAQYLMVKRISQWASVRPPIDKIPAVFIIQAG